MVLVVSASHTATSLAFGDSATRLDGVLWSSAEDLVMIAVVLGIVTYVRRRKRT
jgi:hypothetical protein